VVPVGSVADPYSFDPDPEPNRIQGSADQKLGKNLQLTITKIYLSLGLHKGCSSYRRSLQLSKENIKHFKT
jgi:hypothetical protein